MAVVSLEDHPLQLPYIPDPGKPEDDFASDFKLDFSVRLGASLARENHTETRMVRNELNLGLHTRQNSNQNLNQSVSVKPLPGPSPRGKAVQILRKVTPPSGINHHKVKKDSTSLDTKSPNRAKQLSTILCTENVHQKLRRVFRAVRIISGVCIALKRFRKSSKSENIRSMRRPSSLIRVETLRTAQEVLFRLTSHKSYVQQAATKTWSFMEMYLHMKEDINQVVAFNPQNFARGEPESGKLKQLLSLPSDVRTCADVKAILALMRGNTSFQDYPTHVQIQLAYCMEYQSYEARRIILKQGHRPEAFYILLSGHVMANIEERDVKSGKTFIKTVKEMGPGNTFGEIALIDGGRRTATIVCKTNVQLIVVLKENFDSVIRKQLLKQIHEQAAFCSSLTLFEDFPCHLLEENPSHFFFQYFRKGDVVVKDSKESKYIVIVKSGRCLVVSSHSNDPASETTGLSAKLKNELDAAFPFYQEMKQLKNSLQNHKTEEDKRKESVCLGLLTGKLDKTRLADHGPDIQRPRTAIHRGQNIPNSRVYYRQKSNSMTSYFTRVIKDRKDKIETDLDLYKDLQDEFWSRRLNEFKGKDSSCEATRIKRSKSSTGRPTTVCSSGFRPMSSRLPTRSRSSAGSGGSTTVAQIAEMNAGTVFGLESLVQNPEVTVSLVSDGAECIFISKRFFLNNANIKVLRIITDMVQTYPTRKTIERELRNNRKWNSYKKHLVQEILRRNKLA